MTRSRAYPLLVACLILWLAAPLAAQDDHWTLLQDQQLRFTPFDLIANDTSDPDLITFEPVVTLGPRPAHGDLFESGGDLFYIPDRGFFGIDSFTYSWNGPTGVITGVVELLVTPWITPFSGPFGLPSLPGNEQVEGVGYYNSHSGTFYFCPIGPPTEPPTVLSLSASRHLTCRPYRYSEFKPGWLPLIGNWQDSQGNPLPNRPGLYDPISRTVYLLDEDLSGDCKTCSESIPALSLVVIDQFEFHDPDLSALIPIATDLNHNGIDSIIFFRPSERRFIDVPGLTTLTTTLDDSILWPMNVPDRDGFDEPAVFDRLTGQLDLVIPSTWIGLGSNSANLVIARRVESSIIYRLYDATAHGLTGAERVWPSAVGPCVISGTQILRFPSDPDPPPHGTGTAPDPEPPGDLPSGDAPCS